ncbi:Calreticulin family-domain-containing protein [Phakopsora pachyrhizi]|uniref:Calnexin n=2 Tax=Phakopsora pachyrhizi TaxID=170000 RepID=A0AAV0BLD8_PHAPC|nr:Calreticulin family-domain-containing protein [Phakopsora pachyrhizi]CAH7667995.1 Calreticulin family-domain-containing protein [Phakopsora pachyrhizi]CAH7687539.1 Calreticulin family-domain-containing protein [Phakopsora pachyrhizi]
MRHCTAAAVAALCSLSVLADEAKPATSTVIEKPKFSPTAIKAHFLEQFTSDWSSRWSPSEATKQTSTGGETFSYVGKWEVEEPTVLAGMDGDTGLVVKTPAAHHAISVPFSKTLDNTGKTLVVQYEVKLQNGLECGGAYMKLLKESPTGIQAQEFSDKTEYSIMFGPDRCGATNKVHFIFRHKNPKTGEYEEKHLKNPPSIKNTKTTALYTLIVRPDQTFTIKINDEEAAKGSLLEDFDPPVNPPAEIEDPKDKKPEDWVDESKIVDPDAKKPDDWDEDAPRDIPDEDAEKPAGWLDNEPLTIPDPDAEKPDEWDDEEDGDWVAPAVPNPKCADAPGCGEWVRPSKSNPAYKGKWSAPMIDNPAYKGIWAPRKIPNPNYFEDKTPSSFEPMAGIGIELWTMQENILFDNIYVGHSEEDATAFAKETYHVKVAIENKLDDSSKEDEKDSEKEDIPSFSESPLRFARGHVKAFVDVALVDFKKAVKEMPSTAAALVSVIAAILGALVLVLSGGSSQPTTMKVKKSSKKPEHSTADKGAEKTTDVPTAGGKKEESDVKKRK